MEQELLEVYRKLENERKKKTEAQKERNKLRSEIHGAKSALEVARKRLTEASALLTTKISSQFEPANTLVSRKLNDSGLTVQQKLIDFDAKAEKLIQSRLHEINGILETILLCQQSLTPCFQHLKNDTKPPVNPGRVNIEKKIWETQEDADDGVDVWKEFEDQKKNNTPPMQTTTSTQVTNPGPFKSSTSISASNVNDLLANYSTPCTPCIPCISSKSKDMESLRQFTRPSESNWFQQNTAALLQKVAQTSEKQTVASAVRSPPYIPLKLHAPSSVIPPAVIPSLSEHTATVIWLHSVGETGDMWKDVVLPHMRDLSWIKMIFPTASVSFVSDINMNATSWWNGLADMEVLPLSDEKNIEASVLKTILTVNHEIMNGIEPDRIVLVGVSQGAMIVFRTAYILLSQEIGGVVTMSARLKPNLDFDLIGGNKITVPLFATANENDQHISVEGLKQDITEMQRSAFKAHCKLYPHQIHLPTTNTISDVIEWIQERLPQVFEKKESAFKWM